MREVALAQNMLSSTIQRVGEVGSDKHVFGRLAAPVTDPAHRLCRQLLFSVEGLPVPIQHVFDHYGPFKKGTIGNRINGALIANGAGKALAYALFN